MKVQLVAAAPVDGEMRFPSAGVFEVDDETGVLLIGAGVAIEDDLDARKDEDLAAIAARLGVPIGPDADAAALAAAIRDRWANRA